MNDLLNFLVILKFKIKNFKLYWYVLFIFIWIIKESVLLFKYGWCVGFCFFIYGIIYSDLWIMVNYIMGLEEMEWFDFL